MSDGDKVIHAFPMSELPENILAHESSKPNDSYYCGHPTVSCDDHTRTVSCVKCGAVLDAFNFVLTNARHIQQAWDNYRQAKAKVAELNETIGRLSKEEKRLRARVKNLQSKEGAFNVHGTDKL